MSSGKGSHRKVENLTTGPPDRLDLFRSRQKRGLSFFPADRPDLGEQLISF